MITLNLSLKEIIRQTQLPLSNDAMMQRTSNTLAEVTA